MASVTLLHTCAVIENCEDTWAELVDGDVTGSCDAAVFMVGAGSVKFIVGAGISNGDIIATEAISSTSLAAKTHVALWIRVTSAVAAGDLQLLLDDTAQCASPLETLDIPAVATVDKWTRVVLTLANPSTDLALISIGLKYTANKKANTIYIDDVVAGVGTTYSNVMSIRGVSTNDDIEYWPPIQNQYLDGSLSESISSFRRVVSIDFGVVTRAQAIYFNLFMLASEKRIVAEEDEVTVVLGEAGRFSLTWLDNFDGARAIIMSFKEANMRTTNPPSWV